MNTTPTLALAAIAAAVMLSACGKKEEAPAAVAPTAAPAAETVAAACGKVTVANMNWQSAEVLANIDDIILNPAVTDPQEADLGSAKVAACG